MTPAQEICDFVNAPGRDEVREALRALLSAHNGIDADVVGASRTLDAAARRAGMRVGFSDGELEFTSPRHSVLAAVAQAMADGSWSRIKACRADDCRWAYVDHSRNHSRQWCDMSICGNRAKARRFRSRHA
jgi:predicted RNA-binding Zn ribbon-like protein